MGRVLLGHTDLGLTATYAGGTWQGTLTPENQLTNRLITARARTVDASVLTLDLDLAAGEASYDLISLIEHNLSSLATLRIQVYAETARTTETYDSGTLSVAATADTVVTSVYAHLVPVPVSDAYIRLTITDTVNPDGYLELGRIGVHSSWQPEFNVAYGASLGWEDLSEITESTTGIEFYDKRVKRRTATLPYQVLSDTERKEAEAIIGREGMTGEIMFCFDDAVLTTDYSRTFLARLAKAKDVRLTDFGLNTTSLTLREVL